MNQLSTRLIQQWAELREAHAARSNYLLGLREGEEWYVFAEEDEAERMNERLHRRLRPGAPAAQRREAETALTGWLGFMLPEKEVDRLGISALRGVLAQLTALKNDFNWSSYHDRLADAAAENRADVPLVETGLWQFVLHYADMLNVAQREGRELRPLLRQMPRTAFGEMLPSEQCLELLLLLCRRAYPNHWREDDFERLLNGSHAAVRAFIGPNRRILERVLADGRSAGAASLTAGFHACCAADLEAVMLQELLDDAGGQEFYDHLPPDLREKYAPAKAGKLRQTLSKTFSLGGALGRLTNSAPAAAPRYTTEYTPLSAGGATKWSALPPEDAEELLTIIKNDWMEEQRNWLGEVAALRRKRYLAHVASQLMAPVMVWEQKDSRFLPAWKLPAGRVAEKAREVYAEELKFAAKELAALDKALPQLARIRTLAALNRYEENLPFQRTPLAAANWRRAIDRRRRDLHNQGGYRAQRMREFGIDMADENAFRKNLWLDEMLKIEEEVRPFTPYVRKSFSAALPVGTTIEFDPYRHRHDGVEFDPETVQDQEKWLRGDVMKTLRGRKDYAHICQVNTFCLDYSRSMTHELMRDLFKVVFILVMGLEGRKSYDAIHFFGSDFYEVVNFRDSGRYTNRRILFRVLRNISEIYVNRVVYSGVGGTNISAGVRKSHEKLKAFAAQLREDEPELKFVTSLFVLTDGQPTMGITDLDDLNAFIEEKRRDGNVSIKGIFLKHEDDNSDMISRIFGKEHAVESSTFKETVTAFVQIMGRTYRAQRQDYRAAEKRKRLLGE